MDRSDPMTEYFDAHRPATAFDHDSTLVVAMELSGKSWQLGAVVPGVSRRPKRGLKVGDTDELLRVLERWKAEAAKTGRTVARVIVAYEAGRDGFWIARGLIARGIEVQVMQPASIPVERKSRRAKTDKIDLDMLLRTLLAWLRGEPRVCAMVRVPSVEEEDRRRSGRERDRLTSERVSLENRVRSLLCLHGIYDFRPRLKQAEEMLERSRTRSGAPLPPEMMAELRRAMTRLRLIGEQIDEINAAREAEAKAEAQAAHLEGEQRMIHFLTGIVGVGLETATRLVREVFCRPFRDRRGLACF